MVYVLYRHAKNVRHVSLQNRFTLKEFEITTREFGLIIFRRAHMCTFLKWALQCNAGLRDTYAGGFWFSMNQALIKFYVSLRIPPEFQKILFTAFPLNRQDVFTAAQDLSAETTSIMAWHIQRIQGKKGFPPIASQPIPPLILL